MRVARSCVLWVALIAAGCSSTSNHAILTRQLADPASLIRQQRDFEDLGPVKGRGCRYFLIALIPFGNSSLGKAIDRALEASGGDALLNASVTTSLYGFFPIYNVLSFTCTTVQGVAIRFRDD